MTWRVKTNALAIGLASFVYLMVVSDFWPRPSVSMTVPKVVSSESDMTLEVIVRVLHPKVRVRAVTFAVQTKARPPHPRTALATSAGPVRV